ncbi:MAG: hypothetical protein JWM28_1788, partial [Chitinophagaceae bacterium]|nr:hypothetical protein [Chitinophagaceae bacterium]
QKGEHPAGMDEMVSITKDFTPDAVITEEQMERFRCTLANCTNTSLRDNPQWNTWVKNIPLLKGLSAVAQHNDSIQRLLSFRRPVMIVTGNQTAVFHKRINELLLSLLPDATSLILEGSHAACTSNAHNEFMNAAKEFMVNRSR